jgi:hypothetical protein
LAKILKLDLKQIGYEDVDRIHLDGERDQCCCEHDKIPVPWCTRNCFTTGQKFIAPKPKVIEKFRKEINRYAEYYFNTAVEKSGLAGRHGD